MPTDWLACTGVVVVEWLAVTRQALCSGVGGWGGVGVGQCLVDSIASKTRTVVLHGSCCMFCTSNFLRRLVLQSNFDAIEPQLLRLHDNA